MGLIWKIKARQLTLSLLFGQFCFSESENDVKGLLLSTTISLYVVENGREQRHGKYAQHDEPQVA